MKILKKKIIAIPLLLVLVLGLYFGHRFLTAKNNATRYLTTAVEKGTITVSVSGSGQVAALDQADIKPKVSGDVTYIGVENGQAVKKGTLLVQLDKTDAEKVVENAQINLQQEQLTLDKMMGTTTDEGVIRGEKEKATNDLNSAYDNAFNNVTNAFLNLPNIMTGLYNIIFSYDFSPNQWDVGYYSDAVKAYDENIPQYKADVIDKYQTANTAYNKNFQDYKATNRSSPTAIIDSLIEETYETTKDISDAINSLNNFIQLYQKDATEHNLKIQSLSNTHLSSLNTYTGQTNNYISSLLSSKNTIQTDKETVINSDFDVQNQKIKVAQTQDALADAENTLADYSIYSPFGGVIANVNVKKGDTVSSGTVLVSIITKQQIAEISLNEVDAAKVKVDQKATLTFDALSDVTLTGKVSDVDTLGQVSQGVVSYGVQITLDTQDERVKPGMSVTADIITDAKQDVLVLPNGSIKSQGNSQYVELIENPSDTLKQQLLSSVSGIVLQQSPKQQAVETGLSNDTYTEIVSGLNEGDIVVSSTITSSQNSTTQTNSRTTQGFQIPGVNSSLRRLGD